MAQLAENARNGQGGLATAPDLAEALRLPLPTVRKILKVLARENLLVSQRGAAGGYILAREPREITLLEMVGALEGPLALTECAGGEPCGCARENVCGQRENWSLVNSLLQNTLQSCTLDQMTGSLPPWKTQEITNLEGSR